MGRRKRGGKWSLEHTSPPSLLLPVSPLNHPPAPSLCPLPTFPPSCALPCARLPAAILDDPGQGPKWGPDGLTVCSFPEITPDPISGIQTYCGPKEWSQINSGSGIDPASSCLIRLSSGGDIPRYHNRSNITDGLLLLRQPCIRPG